MIKEAFNLFNTPFSFSKRNKNNFKRNLSLLLFFVFIVMIVYFLIYLTISNQIKSQIIIKDFQNIEISKKGMNFINDLYILNDLKKDFNNKCDFKFFILNNSNINQNDIYNKFDDDYSNNNNTNIFHQDEDIRNVFTNENLATNYLQEIIIPHEEEFIDDRSYTKFKFSDIDSKLFMIDSNNYMLKYIFALYHSCDKISNSCNKTDCSDNIEFFSTTKYNEFKKNTQKIQKNRIASVSYTYKSYFEKKLKNGFFINGLNNLFSTEVKSMKLQQKNHFLDESNLLFSIIDYDIKYLNLKENEYHFGKKNYQLKYISEFNVISSGDLHINIFYGLFDLLPIIFVLFALLIFILKVIFSAIDVYGNYIYLINTFFKMSILKKNNSSSTFTKNEANVEDYFKKDEKDDKNEKDDFPNINVKESNEYPITINEDIKISDCDSKNRFDEYNTSNKNTITSDIFNWDNMSNKRNKFRNSLRFKFNSYLNLKSYQSIVKTDHPDRVSTDTYSDYLINTTTKTDTSLKIIKEDRRNSNLIPFQFKWLDIFKFILPFKDAPTKNKKKLFFSLVEQIDYFMNPSFYLKLCSLTENKVNQLDFTSIYSVLITNDYQNFTINRNMTIYNIINNSKS